MQVTFLGHAGMFIETRRGTILCDPWFNPAYFASWFPFPSNEGVDVDAFAHPDFLYVSHLHRDHFDPELLRARVSRAATVLLPEFPVEDLRRALTDLGFSRFEVLPDREPVELDGLRLMVVTEVSPADGPLGDSALAVDDGTARLLDQNDARPRDMDPIRDFGPYDAHFLQFSGAIWYPVVYAMPEAEKVELGRQKRVRGIDRALRFAAEVGAANVFPCAGPPCFLDGDLFACNDLDGGGTSPFPDQLAFLEAMASAGRPGGHLVVPGSVVELAGGACEVRHPAGEQEVMEPFRSKRAYLDAYRERRLPEIQAARRSWEEAGEGVDVLGVLRGWWEPLLAGADRLCAGVGAPVLLEAGDVAVVVDFPARQVRAFAGEACPYRFRFEPGPFLASVAERSDDWVNGLLLSMRFTAERDGPYNEHLYTFFKCLSPERMEYAEAVAAGTAHAEAGAHAAGPAVARRGRPRRLARANEDEWCEIEGWRVQRRCPHLQGDLSRFGHVEGGVLTCQVHGWRFDLATGRCLTSDEGDYAIKAEPLGDAALER